MRPRRADRRTEPRPAGPPGIAARRAAAELVEGVLERRRSLMEQAGADGPLTRLAPADRARAQGLAATVLRHLGRIDHVLAAFLRRSPGGRAMTALRIAAAELLVEGVPAHAAVDSAVTLARHQPKAQHLAPLVNAVARRVADEGRARWEAAPAPALADRIGREVAARWGTGAAAAIAAVHAARPPLDLTVKRAEETADWADRLGAEVLETGSLRLATRGQVSALPGYAEGAWWVQDAAAALPARMLAVRPGERVLDLCAAPGGKTMQLAAAGADVTALDVSAERLERLEENLRRTGLTARIVTADALDWEPAAPFDAILLDAPCSATGTIRRHPDLPWLRGPEEAERLAGLQAALLRRAFSWLRPGGRLVYATCSLLAAEGEAQAAALLAAEPAARRRPAGLALPAGWTDAEGALRTRPDFWAETGGVDGFYAALIGRAGDGTPRGAAGRA